MNEKRATTRLSTLSKTQLLYIAVVVLLVGPGAIAIVYVDEIYNACVRTVVGPTIRRQFGFTINRRQMYYRTQALDVFVITSVEPTGVLAKAGVRANDVPIGTFHKTDVAFYLDLERSKHEAVELRLINGDEYESLLKEGNLAIGERVRKVLIPRQDGN